MMICAHTSLEEKYRALSRLDDRLGQEPLSSGCRPPGDETDFPWDPLALDSTTPTVRFRRWAVL